VILAGVYSPIFDSALSDYDYREGVSVWFRQFWMFQPDVNLMASAPLGFQIHVMSAILIFALWPFTRLVHVFAAPLGYITRPYIIYRSKDRQTQPERRGWERIDCWASRSEPSEWGSPAEAADSESVPASVGFGHRRWRSRIWHLSDET